MGLNLFASEQQGVAPTGLALFDQSAVGLHPRLLRWRYVVAL